MNEDYPAPTEYAPDIARLTTRIATAVATVFFPPAALVQPVIDLAIEKWIHRPQKILLAELKSGNIHVLSDEKTVQFIPMAYRYHQAAREGEYEHNLKILAAYIANELKEDIPDPSNFSRMARRIEGLSMRELRIIAQIDSYLKKPEAFALIDRPFVSASVFSAETSDRIEYQESLTELASRGLLIADGASRLSKSEEFFFKSSSFTELLNRAGEKINEV